MMSIHVAAPLPFHRDLATEYRMRRERLWTPARLPAPAGMRFDAPAATVNQPPRAPIARIIPIDPSLKSHVGPWSAPRVVIAGGTGFAFHATCDAIRWLDACRERVTVHLVLRAFAAVTCFSRTAICSPSRTYPVVQARQCAMILARRLVSGVSLPLIGGVFGGRDHTTVVNAEHRVGDVVDLALAAARGVA